MHRKIAAAAMRKHPPMPGKLPDKIVLFDSQCNLCNGWSRFLLRRDRDAIFTLCRVQSPAGQRLLQRLGLPLERYETVIYLERHHRQLVAYHRSEAALRVMAQLPAPWRLLRWLRAIPLPLRDSVYDLVARNRYRLFGKRPSCRLPAPGERHRFLEETDVE
ncbi:thiol-disulfide oxidoreductase DCC family protein [Microbulbifer taiwanensis]